MITKVIERARLHLVMRQFMRIKQTMKQYTITYMTLCKLFQSKTCQLDRRYKNELTNIDQLDVWMKTCYSHL